jgi:mannose-6-phosphate isomerase-like protein (cupin superfamily)
LYYHASKYAYHYPYYDVPIYNHEKQSVYWASPDEHKRTNHLDSSQISNHFDRVVLKDYGPDPFVINVNQATKQNNKFRTALWTGTHFQITLMSLKPGEDIGLEMHPNLDQFLRVEQGQGIVQMGKYKNRLNFKRSIFDDSAIVIPAGTWHNLMNTGNKPLKLYSIYAPPNHPFGTVHSTKADAIASERQNGKREFW